MAADPSWVPGQGSRSVDGRRSAAPPIGSRVAAACALIWSVGALLTLVIFTARNLLYVVSSLIAASLGISMWWIAATNGRYRWLAAAAGVVFVGLVIFILVLAGRGTGRPSPYSRSPPPGRSDSWHCVGSSTGPWISARHSVGATRHGVVLMDPTSGGGKVGRFDLVEEARRRGIEPVVLGPGDDLSQLAEAAVHRGADSLGMAGGDGSQAVVARVAAAHGLPFVCVPAGTRNHFALDLGIDRNAPVAALDAFGRGRETTIDLGEVNGEVFVNNVSLGLYGRVVASRSRVTARKGRTVAEVLPDLLLGRMLRQRGSASTDLKVRSPVRRSSRCPTIRTAWRASVASDRSSLDAGMLGVATLTIHRPTDVNRLLALEAAGRLDRYDGWCEGGPRGRGEGTAGLGRRHRWRSGTWVPPLRITIRPGANRVRIAPGQRGASPAFFMAPVRASTLVGLWHIVRGRPSGIVTTVWRSADGQGSCVRDD